MPRKINNKLIEKLKESSLKQLLDYLKKEQKRLKLEVRRQGKFNVYYKKCKVLEVGLRTYSMDKKYFAAGEAPQDIAKTVETDPKSYFDKVCVAVDVWLEKHPHDEFETQQAIAYHNQQKDDRYIILDMEYQFPQNNIEKEKRLKRATFDLLGIDTTTHNAVLFEVKRGLNSLRGKAGIARHIDDFEKHFNGVHTGKLLGILSENIVNIVKDKKELGLLDYTLPSDFSVNKVEFIFIFEPDNNTDIEQYNHIFDRENTSAHKNHYRTIFVSKEDYKLK